MNKEAPSNQDTSTTLSKTQKLSKAKTQFAEKAGRFPRVKQEKCETQSDFLSAFAEGKIHANIKAGSVRIHSTDGDWKSIDVRREWYQPVAWVLDKLSWSKQHEDTDTLDTKRNRSLTYLELACIVDTLTGGFVGPKDATFSAKARIVERMCKTISAKTRSRLANGQSSEDDLTHVKEVQSAAAAGFARLPGVRRRPCFADRPQTRQALGSMLMYAANSPKKLLEAMPRYIWHKVCLLYTSPSPRD